LLSCDNPHDPDKVFRALIEERVDWTADDLDHKFFVSIRCVYQRDQSCQGDIGLTAARGEEIDSGIHPRIFMIFVAFRPLDPALRFVEHPRIVDPRPEEVAWVVCHLPQNVADHARL